jgi:HME family heavy-metal exporter
MLGLVDVQVERRSRSPAIDVRPDERRARLYGTTPAAVSATVSALANGRTLSQVIEGGRRIDVALRLGERERTSVGLGHLLVETPSGRVPVRLVADVSETDAPSRIEREDGRRRVALYANLQGTDLARTLAAVRERLAHQPLPAGASLALEGTFAGQAQAVWRVLGAGLASLAAIFVLLLGRYRSPALALIVMGNVPLSLVGGVVALMLAGLPLSLASVVGFITLAGIAVRNGILKISHYINLALTESASGDSLIVRGSLERLTPVLLTAAATSFALLPLLADPGAAGREILYPVAVVLFGGLLSATILDTFLTPVLFRQFGGRALARLSATRAGVSAGSSF